jgi:hypothetical protein
VVFQVVNSIWPGILQISVDGRGFQRFRVSPPVKKVPCVIGDHLRHCLQVRPDVPLVCESRGTIYLEVDATSSDTEKQCDERT